MYVYIKGNECNEETKRNQIREREREREKQRYEKMRKIIKSNL